MIGWTQSYHCDSMDTWEELSPLQHIQWPNIVWETTHWQIWCMKRRTGWHISTDTVAVLRYSQWLPYPSQPLPNKIKPNVTWLHVGLHLESCSSSGLFQISAVRTGETAGVVVLLANLIYIVSSHESQLSGSNGIWEPQGWGCKEKLNIMILDPEI